MATSEKFVRFNEDRIKKGLPPLPYEVWLKEHYKGRSAQPTIKYLGLERGGPNRGTKNKQELMIQTIELLAKWGAGEKIKWVSMLCNRLGLTPRTVRENYLDPLIQESIIVKIGSKLYFVGPPVEITQDEDEGSKGSRSSEG